MQRITISEYEDVLLPDDVTLQRPDGAERSIPVIANPISGLILSWELGWDEASQGRGESAGWEWTGKTAELQSDKPTLFLALAEGDVCHGMMILSWPAKSRDDPSLELVYVEYLEVAPDNRPTAGRSRKLKGVGAALLVLAKRVSAAVGCGGRIGLNSLPGAEGFYRAFGMENHRLDPVDRGLTYFEIE